MLSVVIVCFNSAPELTGCLAAFSAARQRLGLQVAVVNNSQNDSVAVARICAENDARLIQNCKNIGYGPGCNQGANEFKSGTFTLFLNPDVRMTADAVNHLLALANANPDIVALGPLQAGKDGKVRGKRRSVGQSFLRGGKLRSDAPRVDLMDTGFLSGGALLVKTAIFHRIGGFDENIFLFHEDDDLCLRLSREGRLAYAPAVVVAHNHGSSTPRTPELTRLRSWHLGFSRLYVVRKHYGKLALMAAILHALLKFVSPEMLTAHGRTKAIAFLIGTTAALRRSVQSQAMVPV